MLKSGFASVRLIFAAIMAKNVSEKNTCCDRTKVMPSWIFGWPRAPHPSSIPEGSLVRAVFQEKLMQNDGTEGAPRGDGPSIKTTMVSRKISY